MAHLMMKNQERFVPISPAQGSAYPKVLETIFFMVMLLQRDVLEMSGGHLETGTVKLTD